METGGLLEHIAVAIRCSSADLARLLWVWSGPSYHSSARDRRQVKTLATDKLSSMRRRSEYPSDDFTGVFIKTAAMAEYNSLRLP